MGGDTLAHPDPECQQPCTQAAATRQLIQPDHTLAAYQSLGHLTAALDMASTPQY